MAIEWFDGNPKRLIARLPVADGSYANIIVSHDDGREHRITLRYVGDRANGYPALSPDLDDILAVSPEICEVRKNLERDRHRNAGSKLARQPHLVGYYDALLARHFVCPRIPHNGGPLTVCVPWGYKEHRWNVTLGDIMSVDIHNADT